MPPTAGGGLGYLYAQHMTHLSYLRRRECPRTVLLSDPAEEIKTSKNRGDQIILMGDINYYKQSKKIRSFTAKLGIRELIIDKHEMMGPTTTR